MVELSSHGRGALASLAALALVLAVGCSTPTSTTQIWQARDIPRAPMMRVVVFAGGMTEAERRVFEDGFVASLAERGVFAKPSYELFPALPDKDRARAAVETAGFEGALVSTLHGTRDRVTHLSSGGMWFWGGYYGGTWTPDYVVTDRLVSVETTLWDLRHPGGVLVWTATTQTTNPSTTTDTVKGVANELVPRLADSGLIPAR